MKRGTFRKKTYDELKASISIKNKLKATKSKSAKKTPKKGKIKSLKPLKTKLWELCKQITRLKHKNVCYTCGKTGLEGSSWQTGHFIPSSVGGAYLRYELRNLRPQCYYCNINLGGNGSAFYKNLVEREGQEYVNQIFKDKNIIIKADQWWFISKIAEYEIYLQELRKGNSPNI